MKANLKSRNHNGPPTSREFALMKYEHLWASAVGMCIKCQNQFTGIHIVSNHHSCRYRLFLLTQRLYCYFQVGHAFFWGGGETAVEQWLRCCATNRKVAGSIPEGVIGIFHWHNPSDSAMVLGPTQPLTEMSTRRICGRCVRLTSLPPPCAVVMKSRNLNFLEPSGPLQTCNGSALPLSYMFRSKTIIIWGCSTER